MNDQKWVDQKNTLGVSSYTKAAVSWESIVGAKFLQTTGIMSDTSQGISFKQSMAVGMNMHPLTINA